MKGSQKCSVVYKVMLFTHEKKYSDTVFWLSSDVQENCFEPDRASPKFKCWNPNHSVSECKAFIFLFFIFVLYFY